MGKTLSADALVLAQRCHTSSKAYERRDIMPFNRCNREQDYETAWRFFEEKYVVHKEMYYIVTSENLKIGIALSGGGIRATIFHLGVLKWMAENSLLDKTSYISTVSGASLCVGLIYSCNDLKWPGNEDFRGHVLERVKEVILNSDIQNSALLRVFPFWLTRKANLLAKVFEKKWNINGTFSDIDDFPTWCVNCTTYETGKRFHITQKTIGDYAIGYADNHHFRISDAMAASAGFPFLIGPYRIKRKQFNWSNPTHEIKDELIDAHFSRRRHYHLWDGGVYDNLGIESIFKIGGASGGHFNVPVNYIIVSNAGAVSGSKRRIWTSNPKRLLDIAMNQVVSLRSRIIVSYMQSEKSGLFLNIGNCAGYILEETDVSDDIKLNLVNECLSKEHTSYVRSYNTNLKKPSVEDFDLILQHGYEVAKCTSLAYNQF